MNNKVPSLFIAFLFMAIGLSSFTIKIELNPEPPSVEALSKKWTLDKYVIEDYTEQPSTEEQGDFIQFYADMTFTSRTEGKTEGGKWKLDPKNKTLALYQEGVSGEYVFRIAALDASHLVLVIKDPSDKELENLKIHYKN